MLCSKLKIIMMLKENVIPFLTDLYKNNNKDWFTSNKSRFQLANDDFKQFIDDLIPRLAQTEPLLNGLMAKDCVYRIYRDVRFSKDKTRYKTHFGAHMAPGGRKSKHAGFYFHVEPSGKSIVGGGIYMPEPAILKALRTEFYQVPEELLEILDEKEFKKYFDGLWFENKLKLAPKGFPKDFEHIDLLKHKNYMVLYELSKKEIESSSLVEKLVTIHKAMYPLNRLINTIIEDAHLQ
jgi:uncharacterized protein (TIGR02453 family)